MIYSIKDLRGCVSRYTESSGKVKNLKYFNPCEKTDCLAYGEMAVFDYMYTDKPFFKKPIKCIAKIWLANNSMASPCL